MIVNMLCNMKFCNVNVKYLLLTKSAIILECLMPKSKKDQGLNLLKKVKKAKLDEHESAHSTITSSVPASPSLPAVVPVPIQQHTPRSDTSSYPKSSNLAQRQMEYCQFMSDFPSFLSFFPRFFSPPFFSSVATFSHRRSARIKKLI